MGTRKQSLEVRGVATGMELAAANDLMAKTQLPNYWDSLHSLQDTGPNWQQP